MNQIFSYFEWLGTTGGLLLLAFLAILYIGQHVTSESAETRRSLKAHADDIRFRLEDIEKNIGKLDSKFSSPNYNGRKNELTPNVTLKKKSISVRSRYRK